MGQLTVHRQWLCHIVYICGCHLCIAAPEKVAGENVGVAADIWGVGVLAFIL